MKVAVYAFVVSVIGFFLGSLNSGCSSASTAVGPPTAPTGPTQINVRFASEPTPFWEERLRTGAASAQRLLLSERFAKIFVEQRMTRTNGKSAAQVCHHLQNAGPIDVVFAFYHDTNTRAIAYEADGVIHINTAHSSAGSPGNIAHELTHQLGYTHFTNFPLVARHSVPYVTGRVIDEMYGAPNRPLP